MKDYLSRDARARGVENERRTRSEGACIACNEQLFAATY
jgi:hypothetical protein